MNNLWTPGSKTPQLGEAAKSTAIDRAFSRGILPEAITAWEDLLSRDKPLGQCVENLGSAIDGKVGDLNVIIPPAFGNKVPVQGLWTKGVLKLASGITLAAYREAGYVAPIDDTAISTGTLFAEIGGIPDSYGISTHEDPALVALVDTLAEAGDLQGVATEVDSGKVRTILFIGAGCARHYLQQALEQAA